MLLAFYFIFKTKNHDLYLQSRTLNFLAATLESLGKHYHLSVFFKNLKK